MPHPVTIPLLNANEPEALLVALHAQEGQWIPAGTALCTLETTKSTTDLMAEQDGYIVGLRFEQGQTVHACDLLCFLAEDPAWVPPQTEEVHSATPGLIDDPLPTSLRITQPALLLARQHSLDLERLPTDHLVTESDVRALIEGAAHTANIAAGDMLPASAFDPTAILIYGGGGHGKSLIDLIRLLGIYHIVGVLDDGIPAGEDVLGLHVLGGSEVLPRLYAEGVRLAVNAVGGIGNLGTRIRVFHKLAEAGFTCPAVVHPRAFVEASATLSPGVQVFAHAYVGSQARLGLGCIVNTSAILSHDCLLSDYANISPGAMLAGEVQIGAGALVGMGVTINLRVKVGAGARIGNGATVKEDVPERGVVGAGKTWPVPV
jgi:acetyltransferase EpsM